MISVRWTSLLSRALHYNNTYFDRCDMKFVLCCMLWFVICLFFFDSCGAKNYEVSVVNGKVEVVMKAPSIGAAGFNEVAFDGFTLEEIEEEIFDEIQDAKYGGDYEVYVTLRFKNRYGRLYERESVKVCTLDAMDVKKYVNYSYFRGNIPFENAFQWNHDYMGVEREVVEPELWEKFIKWTDSTWGRVLFAVLLAPFALYDVFKEVRS